MRVIDNGSNIRFAGEEALGNGLKAWWQVESAIGVPDNQGTAAAPAPGAANATTIGTRNTAVGIKGAWGNLFVGKWDAHYNSGNQVDTVNGPDAYGSAGQALNLTHGNGAVATATGRGAPNTFGGRLPNSIVYITPKWNGVDATFNYSTQSENLTAGTLAKDKAWAFTPKYAGGPIMVFYSHFRNSNNGASTTSYGNHLTGNRLGGAYTFPMGLKIGLVWDKNKIETANGAAGLAALGIAATGGNVGAHSRRERIAWALPIQYQSGPHRFNITYARTSNLKTDAGTVGSSSARMYFLGYEYSLSKRTSVAALYSTIRNGANAAYDFREASANITGSLGAGLPAGADPRTFQLGLRHVF
jgi:predicted porin